MAGHALAIPTRGILAGAGAAASTPTEPDPCADFPSQWWLIRDPLLVGEDVITAASEYGPRLGFVVPADDVQGTMAATAFGEPDDDTAQDISFKIVKGGRAPVAEFAYRPDSEEWRGYHSDLYEWGHHCPLPATHPDGAVLLHSRVHRRVLVISSGTSTVMVSYVDANARPGGQSDWTTSTFTPDNGLHQGGCALAGCELQDGSLLLGVRRATLNASNSDPESQGDWDLYRSTDGGLTWSLLFENMLQYLGYRANDFTEAVVTRIAASGDWVRWIFVDDSTIVITAVSSDRGTSWEATADLDTSDVGAILTDQNFDVFPCDLVAIDEAGTFLFVTDPNGGANQAQIWYATRSDDWTASSKLSTVSIIPGQPRNFVFVKDPYWLYLWVGGWGSGISGSWTLWRVVRESAISGTWEGPWSDPHRLRGAVRLAPTQVQATWVGDRAAMLYYLQDTSGGTPYPHETDRPVLFWLGGWSSRPANVDFVRQDGAHESVHWDYSQGQPAGGVTSATQSQWVNTIASGGTHSWTVFSMAFESYNSGDTSMQRITIPTNDGRDPPQWDPDSGELSYYRSVHRFVAEWSMAVGATGNATATNVGVRIKMPSKAYPAGPAWELMFRIGPVQTVVYDEARGFPLATLTTITTEDTYRRYRFCVDPATTPSNPYGNLMWRRETGDTWEETARFDLGQPYGASGITQFSAQFGHLGHTPASTMFSWWRELHVFGERFRTNYAQSGGYDVDDYPGAPVSPRPRYLGAGATGSDAPAVALGWGGGGAAKGDRYTHEMEHSAGAAQIGLDSPRDSWYSVAGQTAGATLIYDAARGAAVDTGERFTHSHIALYGLENTTVIVDYAQDSEFTTGVVAGATVSAVQYSGVRVSAKSGATVTLDPSTTTGIRPGELAGRYLSVSAAVTAGSIGTIHKIASHLYDGTNHMVTLATGGQWGATVISVGDTVSMFSDRVWTAYDQTISRRYMRLTFGTTGQNNWDGRFRLGQLIAGIARRFVPVLDWSFRDEETPNVTIERSRGGQSWAYTEGPATRQIVGRMVGDVTGARAELRDQLRTIGEYAVQPIALLLNLASAKDQDRSLLLARWEGSTNMDNAAWSSDDDGIERPAGDLEAIFVEIT